jgi:hypothetical protein
MAWNTSHRIVFAGLVVLSGAAWSEGVSADEVEVGGARRLPLTAPLLSGAVEHRTLTLRGLPLRGAFETVAVDASGDARVVASQRPSHPPQLDPGQAEVAVDELPDIVARYLGERAGHAEVEQPPEMVYLVILGRPVLAWEVHLSLLSLPEPSRPTLWISAATGRVLEEVENVFSSRARVFAENPAVTPVPITVDLGGIQATGAGAPLSGKRVVAYNCVTEWPEDPDADPANAGWWDVDSGRCYPRQLTFSDGNGDYMVPLPDVKYVEEHIQAEDLYAEVSMYYHAERFLDLMEEKGVDGFPCERPTMLANFHNVEPAFSYPELPYGPYNNAWYTGACDPKGPTMQFGQGSSVDFSYDGDVVYHELGHGIVRLLAPESLGRSRRRPDGLVRDAFGINETVADYLSLMGTGDPLLADYIGRYWPTYSRPYIRNAENEKRCPQNMRGESHSDGEPLTAALWATRKRVGEVVDRILLMTVTRLPRDADLELASATLLDVADELRAEGELSDFGYDVLYRSLDARGLLDCPRVITDPEDVAAERTLYVLKKSEEVEPYWPGPMQIRHTIPNGSDNLIVSFRESPTGTSTGNPNLLPVDSRVLIKRDDEPIEFTYDLVAIDQNGETSEDPAEIVDVTLVRGDWDEELDPTELGEKQRYLIVRGLLSGEVVHLAFVNMGATDAVLSRLFVTSVPSEDLDEGSPEGGEPEEEGTDTASGSDDTESHGNATGKPVTSPCTCRTGGDPAQLLGLLALLPWLRRRRRPGSNGACRPA